MCQKCPGWNQQHWRRVTVLFFVQNYDAFFVHPDGISGLRANPLEVAVMNHHGNAISGKLNVTLKVAEALVNCGIKRPIRVLGVIR
jgi:hypothetical protein